MTRPPLPTGPLPAAPPLPALPLEFSGHEGILDEFVRSLRSGAEPQTVCHDNIKSLAMCLAAVESAKSGRKVEVKW